jgi:hypothetical protein
MVHNAQNSRVYGLGLLSGILNNLKTRRFGNWFYFRLQVRGGKHILCWVPLKELNSVTGPDDALCSQTQ